MMTKMMSHLKTENNSSLIYISGAFLCSLLVSLLITLIVFSSNDIPAAMIAWAFVVSAFSISRYFNLKAVGQDRFDFMKVFFVGKMIKLPILVIGFCFVFAVANQFLYTLVLMSSITVCMIFELSMYANLNVWNVNCIIA